MELQSQQGNIVKFFSFGLDDTANLYFNARYDVFETCTLAHLIVLQPSRFLFSYLVAKGTYFDLSRKLNRFGKKTKINWLSAVLKRRRRYTSL